jgi:CheY-like chemotaxis protein
MGKRILAIDDEALILTAIKVIFEEMGHTVDTACDPVEGIGQALANDYDLILLDMRMPMRNGAEVVEEVRGKKPGARFLVLTGYPNDPLVERAMKAGAIGALRKPFEIAKILEHLQT